MSFPSAPGAAEPGPDEIESIRGWIRDLTPAAQACPSRQSVRPADVDKMMRDAQHLERDQGKDVRFISLVHLYNACATPSEMAAYRQALNKLMNSLSWAAEPVKLTPLDAAGTVLSFRLSEFGWVSGHWELIQRAYPPTLVHTVADDVSKTANTKVAIVNGDWLAAATAETPLYYALLGLPAKLSELAKMNATNIDQNIRSSAARRIAVRVSAVTRGNRLIERHPGGRGGFWLVYDFATSTGDQDIFEHPQGPKSATPGKSPFKPDQIRALFALPNGFYAFALFDAAGNRIDRVLPGLEKPYAGVEADALEPTTKAGANCFACHTDGLIRAQDEFRAAGPSDASAPPSPSRTAALPLFGTDSENALLMIGSIDRYRMAARAADVDLGLRIRGEELVSGLARRYREDADFEAALGETGLERQEFLTQLTDAKGAAAPLARRLLHGVLPRPEVERLFALLKGIDAPGPSTSGGFLREVKSEIGLSMWIDKPRPVPGDLVTIKAEADNSCYLTVISVDAAGVATVLFPNDFTPDNLITAGQPVSLPGSRCTFPIALQGRRQRDDPGPLLDEFEAAGRHRARLRTPALHRARQLGEFHSGHARHGIGAAHQSRESREGTDREVGGSEASRGSRRARRSAASGRREREVAARWTRGSRARSKLVGTQTVRLRRSSASTAPATIEATAGIDCSESVDRPVTPCPIVQPIARTPPTPMPAAPRT